MKLTITGSSSGISDHALTCLRTFMKTVTVREVHHGDCIGSDEIFHKIMREYLVRIIIHPVCDQTNRAYCNGDIIFEEKDFVTRNKEMVDLADLIIAFPKTYEEEIISRAWSIIRYAREIKKSLMIVFPNGSTIHET